MGLIPVDILIGKSAHQVLDDVQFMSAWQRLYTRSQHATVFQSPTFVSVWYQTYRVNWEPVIVRSVDSKGEMVGLWLLAYSPKQQELVHAGGHQAEYQVWLTLPGADAIFLESAWLALKHQLSFETLRFKYLPAIAIVDALRNVAALNGCLTVRTHIRPLMTIDLADIKSSFAKKSNKSRFNRLKKLGVIEFRRLSEPDEVEAVFDEFIDCYDFRQGAINHVTPFREDPLKREFHVNLFAASLEETYFTVTYLNGRAIAGFWGATHRQIVHLGMLVYSPFFAAHSPGKLHIMQLCERLFEDGKTVLDLTPGGDPWKERFANSHDEVAELIFYRSKPARRRADFIQGGRQWAKRWLARVGVQPANLQRVLMSMRSSQPTAILRKVRSQVYVNREYRVYRGDRAFGARFASDVRVSFNAISDLLCFDPIESWQSRDAFLSSALSRLENGESVYTICINNCLAHYGWMIRGHTKSYSTEVQQSINLPPQSVALYDYYTHPHFRGRGLYRATIGHMLHEAFNDAGAQYAYISVLADNLPSRHVIESLGFEHQGSLYWKRKLCVEKKWASSTFE